MIIFNSSNGSWLDVDCHCSKHVDAHCRAHALWVGSCIQSIKISKQPNIEIKKIKMSKYQDVNKYQNINMSKYLNVTKHHPNYHCHHHHHHHKSNKKPLQRLGMGMGGTIHPVYVCELTSPAFRGALAASGVRLIRHSVRMSLGFRPAEPRN